MSHEFRTPLNAVLGFSQLLIDDPELPGKHRQYVEIIDQSGAHLLRLIDGVLSFIQLESEPTLYVPTKLELEAWLRDLLAPFVSQARAKGLSCQLQIAADLPAYIQTDATKLQQILWHLLDNALKFSSQGGMVLRVDWQAESFEPGKIQLEFAVEDTGVGFDPAELQRWFEPFAQTRSSQQPSEGTGIGLALARRAVELLGGQLQAESTPGQGSCFRFAIPVKAETAPTNDRVSRAIAPTSLGLAPGQPAYRLLVATQAAGTSRRLQEFLTPLGFAVEIAASLDHLPECWQRVQPHLVLVEATATAGAAIAACQIRTAPASQWVALIAEDATEDVTGITAYCTATLPLAWPEPALLDTLASCLGAHYLYRQPESRGTELGVPLKAADLQGLPSDWLQALYEATMQIDEGEVRAVVAQLGPEQAQLQQQLLALANDFRFDLLLELMQGALL
ncbi:MAG: hypothetical protein HC910_11270 [Spirulinaceae cyanobacterium SM2_1_0]|nr:hypothetical protein [Spirulinaceae cyanobacterium SM2_1_0]